MVTLPFTPIKKKKYWANSMLIKVSGPDGLNARVLKCSNEISLILAMKEIEPCICVKDEKIPPLRIIFSSFSKPSEAKLILMSDL